MKKAAPTGITKRKIIVVPCMVNMALYWSAVRKVASAEESWIRSSRASSPPTMKKMKAVYPYMIPIFLWSTVVNQPSKPVFALGRRKMVVVGIGRVVAVTAGSPGRR